MQFADASASEILLDYVVFPAVALVISGFGAWLVALPAIRTRRQRRESERIEREKAKQEEQQFRDNVQRVLLGQERDPSRGIWVKTDGLADIVGELKNRVDHHLGPMNGEPLVAIVKQVRRKLDDHCDDASIHLQGGTK